MIKLVSKGGFDKTTDYLKKLKASQYGQIIEKYAKQGVEELSNATPVRTGLTAASWSYVIQNDTPGRWVIEFHNSNVNEYVNIALILDAGHATKSGSWVEGKHYIDPALEPIIQGLSKDLWEEVVRV